MTLERAKKVIAASVSSAKKNNAPGGVIAVVDDGGNLMALERLDGTFAAGANISIGKARTVHHRQVIGTLRKNFPKARAKSILRVVERELLTPCGLRTLSPNDPRYVGRYEGNPRSRDSSYHQGTVWPWLMGSYMTAYAKTFGENEGRGFATEWLKNFDGHLREACLGQVSEIFDGDAPHTPRGCVAQAWSVAELLCVAVENIYATDSVSRAARAS